MSTITSGLGLANGVDFCGGQGYVVGGNAIRVFLPGGGSSAFAGSSTAGSQDGIGTSATMRPFGIKCAGSRLFVADQQNHLIRQIDISTAAVTTVAGGGCAGCTAYGFADGIGTAATFSNPSDLAYDGMNMLYIVVSEGSRCGFPPCFPLGDFPPWMVT